MKLGAEPKKMAALAVLGLVLAYVVWDNVLSTPSPTGAATTTMPSPNIAAVPKPGVAVSVTERPGPDVRRKKSKSSAVEQFIPTLLPKRGPNGEILRPDPLKVDPQLRLEVLAKLQGVNYTGPGRNLFEFGSAPPPPPTTPDPKIQIGKPVKPALEPMRYATRIGPDKDPPPPPLPPPPPQPPPITLKFYGYVGPRGVGKKAFFLDGEDILVATEGELLKQRYRVVRIGLASAELQDTQFPQSRAQQIPLTEEPIA